MVTAEGDETPRAERAIDPTAGGLPKPVAFNRACGPGRAAGLPVGNAGTLDK